MIVIHDRRAHDTARRRGPIVLEHERRAALARLGDFLRLPAHRDLIQRYRAAANGRPSFVSQLRFVYVAETEREAKEQTRLTFQRYAKYDCGVDWDGRTDSDEYVDLSQKMHFVIGTPDQVTAQLTEWQDWYGFDEIMCQLYAAGMTNADSLRSLNLLGSEVMPRLLTDSPHPNPSHAKLGAPPEGPPRVAEQVRGRKIGASV